ncbi:RHS repeat-associated core domain-containing protein [Cognatiluteimonas telluris]|uniref:RHS repeat-associated core domain-containing protein n=1 Tax=Cognatiluteimonas telluris TaxID=1104775 RepID=UPI00311AA70B
MTPEITALAASLGHNPVQIFNWVHNNIDFVPTHGAIQGAGLTLANRRGNAADTNSLLAALLRASGIPTRFVYGTVDVPVAQALNWLKAGDVDSATHATQVGGIPTTILKLDGQIKALRFQHLWVEANIDFTPSRGAINRQADAWIPMDASFKQYTMSPPVDVLGLGDWNATTAANSLLDGASIGADGSVTGLNTTRYHAYTQDVIKRIADQATDDSLRDPQVALGKYSIIQTRLPVITGTLPFAVSAAATRFTAIPSSLKYFVDIQQFATAQDIALENPALALRLSTVELAGQSIYVDYAPATASDAMVLESYASSNAAALPLTALNVVPRLMLGDRVLATGSPVPMGTQQYWKAAVPDLQGHVSGITEPYQFAAGSRISFTPDLGGVGEELLGASFKGLGDSSEQSIATALHLAGVQYWYLNDSRAALYARGWGGQFLRMPSIGAFAAPLQVRYFFGIPRTGYFSGFATDIKADRVGVVLSDPEKATRLTFQIGANGSLSESLTWDLLLNNRPGDSLSASSILAWANQAHVAIYTITAANIDTLLPRIQTTSDVKDEIRNAVNSGMQVVIPEKEFAKAGVQAAGYVIADPETGAAIYRVDGGLNGAINVGCIAKAVLLKVICESKFATLMAERLAILAGRFAVSIGLEAVLAAVAPPLAIILPIVSAVLIAVTIIETTYEVLTWVREVMNGNITLTADEMAAAGIRAINDYACNYLSPCFNNPVGYLANQAIDEGLSLANLGSAGPGGPTAGNPVSIGTGIKTQVEPDYQGEGPFPLSYTRTYVSYLPNGSPVGHRWVSNYHHHLALPDGATAMAAPDAVLVQRGDGSWLQFAYRSGTYVVNGDIPDRLERVNDGLGRTTGWLLHAKDDTTEGYDPDGRLLWIDNRTGLRQSLTYGADGQLDAVTDSFGRSLHFERDPATHQVSALIDPENRRTTYEYENGALSKVTYPDLKQRQYHYEMPGWPTLLTGITDERGVRYVSWKYDDDNRVVESTHAGGADLTRFSYGDNATTVTDPRGAVRTYHFTRIFDSLRMTQVSDPCSSCSAGGTSTIAYDGNGYPTLLTDFNGNKSQVHIDTRGLPEQWTRGLGTPDTQTVNVQWHPQWRVPVTITETSATGSTKVTNLTYDDRGNPKQRSITVDGQTRAWAYVFNAAGQMEQVDGPRSDVDDITRYTYDGTTGNLTQVVDGNGLTTRYPAYDVHGHVRQMIDPNGLVTDYRYDERDRLVETKLSGPGLAAPEITAFEYQPIGNLAKLTLPDGSWLQYEYDDAQRLTSILDSRGNRIRYGLDPAGDRTQEQTFAPDGALAQTVNRVIDNLGRMAQAYGADPAEAVNYSYDGNGNERTALVPLHDLPTESRYDALDRLRMSIDPAQGSVTYDYDAQDNLRKVTDPRGLATRYDYDGFNELATLTSPDTGITRFGYDAAGNLTSRTDARNIAGVYAYDAENRLASIAYPDETLAYHYDEPSGGPGAKGRLTTVQDGSGQTSYVYDVAGRVTQKSQQLGASSNTAALKTLSSSYVSGRVDETVLPSGARLQYRYGADGRVQEILLNGQTLVSQIAYFPFGEPMGWTSVAGRYERTFDTDGRVAGFTSGSSSTSLAFDTAGRIASAEDAGAGPAWRYRYDAADRLSDADNASGSGPLANLSLHWTYDPTGNRTSQQRVVGATPQDTDYTIDPASNRLMAVAGQARAYDAIGNTTSSNGQAFVYSGRGRLAEVRLGATVQARYQYNALGERVCAAYNGNSCPSVTGVGGGYTQFVYDNSGHLLGEYDAIGNLLAEHVWLGDTPVAVLKPSAGAGAFGGQISGDVAAYFVEPDQLDTPRAIVNAGNSIVWRWESMPFGETTAIEDPNGLGNFSYRLRFPGQQFDGISQTHYNHLRDYDPTSGRYVESDPIGLEGGFNTYAYVDSDVLSDRDPEGERSRAGRASAISRIRNDPKTPSCVKGWLKQEENHILRGGRGKKLTKYMRLPPGFELAHLQDQAACSGCDYKNTVLQNKKVHNIQTAVQKIFSRY